jgi:hypothetical protein
VFSSSSFCSFLSPPLPPLLILVLIFPLLTSVSPVP